VGEFTQLLAWVARPSRRPLCLKRAAARLRDDAVGQAQALRNRQPLEPLCEQSRYALDELRFRGRRRAIRGRDER